MKFIFGCFFRDCRGDCRGVKGSIGWWFYIIYWFYVVSLRIFYLIVCCLEYVNIIYFIVDNNLE